MGAWKMTLVSKGGPIFSTSMIVGGRVQVYSLFKVSPLTLGFRLEFVVGVPGLDDFALHPCRDHELIHHGCRFRYSI